MRHTVTLAVTADSHKLPLFVIFRIEPLPKDRFLSGIVIFQDRWWKSEEFILEWFNMAWKRWLGILLCKYFMLV